MHVCLCVCVCFCIFIISDYVYLLTDLERVFQEEPHDLTIHLGDTAMFACRIGGAPTPTVRWFRDELEIDPYDVNYDIHEDGVLEISSVQFTQLGRYKCKAENSDRSRTSRVAILQQNSDTCKFIVCCSSSRQKHLISSKTPDIDYW